MSSPGISVTDVIIDAVDINQLANNVVSHLVRRRDPRAKESLPDNEDEEEGTQDTVDGPGSAAPYAHRSATTNAGHRLRGSRNNKVQIVTQAMLKIANELDEKEEIWQAFSQLDIGKDTAYETFCDVAMGLFSHGISWGKVVMLFLFAAHCVVKAVLAELPNILLMICTFVARFMGDRLRNWIEDHGGWSGLLDPQRNPLLVIVGVLLIGGIGGIAVKAIWDRYT